MGLVPIFAQGVFGMKRVIVIAAVLVLLRGCAGSGHWDKYELCFGLSAESGETRIGKDQWNAFLQKEIVPRFPDGFTVYDAEGHWADREGRSYSEDAKVLMIVAPPGEGPRKKIEEIRRIYKQRFRQESVLLIRAKADVDF